MENNQTQKEPGPVMPGNGSNNRTELPNSVTVLVLGILSIIFSCWYFSILGLILGIITLVLANQAEKVYNEKPDSYTTSSYKNMKAGKTCAIIGLAVASFFFVIIVLVIFGLLVSIPLFESIDAFNNY